MGHVSFFLYLKIYTSSILHEIDNVSPSNAMAIRNHSTVNFSLLDEVEFFLIYERRIYLHNNIIKL